MTDRIPGVGHWRAAAWVLDLARGTPYLLCLGMAVSVAQLRDVSAVCLSSDGLEPDQLQMGRGLRCLRLRRRRHCSCGSRARYCAKSGPEHSRPRVRRRSTTCRAHTRSDEVGYRGELQHQDRVHLRNRDYDPTTGTFLTKDPLGVGAEPEGRPTSANLFAYVGNDPLNFVDPLGLCRVTDVTFQRDGSLRSGPGNLDLGQCKDADASTCNVHGANPRGYGGYWLCEPDDEDNGGLFGQFRDEWEWLEYHGCRVLSPIAATCGQDPSPLTTAFVSDEAVQACAITVLTMMPGGTAGLSSVSSSVVERMAEVAIKQMAASGTKYGAGKGLGLPSTIDCVTAVYDHAVAD
ncbi:MAG: RHS repeat-associated core domain-containing protein [bacterium]|nr:RHS repeat-associated core domain-containing protein [bacterium]